MSSELDESMKIPKDKDENSNNFIRIFGLEFKQEQLDDDAKIWTEEKLRNKLMEMGTIFLRQLGQDVQGNYLLYELFLWYFFKTCVVCLKAKTKIYSWQKLISYLY